MNRDRDKSLSNLKDHLKGASLSLLDIEQLLLYQERIISQQADEIADLKRRLKEFENMKLNAESIDHYKTIQTQMKNQIEFLKFELQEKDSLLALSSKQQHQQIAELQQKLGASENTINQFKKTDKAFDQIFATISTKPSAQGVLGELQQYPEALQILIIKIQEEFKRMQALIDEKDRQLQNMQSSQMQIPQKKETISQEDQTKIAKQKKVLQDQMKLEEQTLDALANEVNKKRAQVIELRQQNNRFSTEVNLLENFQEQLSQKEAEVQKLKQQLTEKNSNTVNSINDQIRKSFKQSQDNNYQQDKTDDLVMQNLQLDELIRELEIRIVNKKDLLQQLQDEIKQWEKDTREKQNLLKVEQQNNETLQKQLQQQQLQNQQLSTDLEAVNVTKQSQQSQQQQQQQQQQQLLLQQSPNKNQSQTSIGQSPSNDYEIKQLKETIKQQQQQIEFLNFEIQEKDQQLGSNETQEVKALVQQNKAVENRIQELKSQLDYRSKRKDQLESIIQQDTSSKKSENNKSEIIQLQEQLHGKNMTIVSLHEEISKLQRELYELQQEANQREMEVKFNDLMRNNKVQCEQADELVRQNIAIDNLIHELEVRLVEKDSRLKELEQQNQSKDHELESSFLQDARESQILIKSYDQESDSMYQIQQQALSGIGGKVEQMQNKIDALRFEICEKDKMIEQLNKQQNELKKQNYNQQILATADQGSINNYQRQNKQLQDQADNIVKQNLALEDVIHDLEYRLNEKQEKKKELEKQMNQCDLGKQQIQDELIRKNLEIDQTIQNLEQRYQEKQQQFQQYQQKLSTSRLSQPLQVFQEEVENKIRVELPVLAEHQQNLNELSLNVQSITENVRQLQQDDAEYEILQNQKQEKMSKIEQLKLFLKGSDDLFNDLQEEQQQKLSLIEKLKQENKEIEKLIQDLHGKQNNLIDNAVSSNKNLDSEQIDIQQVISTNLEKTKEINALTQKQKQLKQQSANLESIILDLQLIVRERQDELQRVSQENYNLSLLSRKQKQKRDHLFREQLPLAEKVGLLEQQVAELSQESNRLEPQLSILFQQFEQMQQIKSTKEQQIQQFSVDNTLLEERIYQIKEDIEQNQQLQKTLDEQLQNYKQNNSNLEQEVKIYTSLSNECQDINKKIESITNQIEEEKSLYQSLQQEMNLKKEQVQLLIPQNKEIQNSYTSTKTLYDTNVQKLSQLQIELQQITDHKNQIEQEVNYLKLFAADQEKQIDELCNNRMFLEERIKQENSLKNAVQDKADRILQQLDEQKNLITQYQNESDKLRRDRDTKAEQIKQLTKDNNDMKNKIDQLLDMQMKYSYQLELIIKLEKDIDNQVKIIYEKEEQIETMELTIQSKIQKNKEQLDKNKQLEQELQFYQKEELEIKGQITKQDMQLVQIEKDLQKKREQRVELLDQIANLNIGDLEQQFKEKQEYSKKQHNLEQDINVIKLNLQSLQDQQHQLNVQKAEQEVQLKSSEENLKSTKQKFQQNQQEISEISVKYEEMNFQLQEQQSFLDRLNEQFRKLDEDTKMMEGVIQLKEKEYQSTQAKKEKLLKSLEETNQELNQVQKKVMQKKKLQKSIVIQEEEVDDDFQDKIANLQSRKTNLIEDLQQLVQQNPEPTEQLDNSQHSIYQEQAQLIIKDREKRIEILEQTIQTLQQQNQERNSVVPSMFQSKISVQPSFYFDDDPLLLELQDKFTKESELLLDLQTKLKKTAERHHDLAIRLQEWAEKENRLANELDTRRISVEKIEQELQSISVKQFDLESEKVNVLQRIYQLEIETQEILESEVTTKGKLREKKEYVQQLVRTITEMDEKLFQLRNRMAHYTQEGRALQEQVENLENEKEGRLQKVQSIQEELEELEVERQEKSALIESIRKTIQEGEQEKEKYENQYGIVHGKNLQLKGKIGLAENLYSKLVSELEKEKKRDQLKYLNLFNEEGTQTNYEEDQMEGLIEQFVSYKITKQDLQDLKQGCVNKLQQLREQTLQITDSTIKQFIQTQQILIAVQEGENQQIIENSSRHSSKLQKEDQIEFRYNLEIINLMLKKTSQVEVIVNEHSIQVGEEIMARQWIMQKSFDYDNELYPLGVLHIIYKISLYQVMTISLTGTKIIQLYQYI